MKLAAQVTLAFLSSGDQIKVSVDDFDGVPYSKHEWRVMVSFAGQPFDAVLDSDLDEAGQSDVRQTRAGSRQPYEGVH